MTTTILSTGAWICRECGTCNAKSEAGAVPSSCVWCCAPRVMAAVPGAPGCDGAKDAQPANAAEPTNEHARARAESLLAAYDGACTFKLEQCAVSTSHTQRLADENRARLRSTILAHLADRHRPLIPPAVEPLLDRIRAALDARPKYEAVPIDTTDLRALLDAFDAPSAPAVQEGRDDA